MIPRPNKLDTLQAAECSAQAFSQRPEKTALKDWRLNEAFERFDQAHDGCEILGAGPALVFMGATEQDRVWMQRGPRKQQAGPLRAMELVGTDGNEVGVELLHFDEWLFAEPLDRVGVEQDTVLSADCAQLGYRLDCADFVVCGH